jgi:hypothetical protein
LVAPNLDDAELWEAAVRTRLDGTMFAAHLSMELSGKPNAERLIVPCCNISVIGISFLANRLREHRKLKVCIV